MLQADAATFVHLTRDAFVSLDPEATTMCIVAIKNLSVMLAVMEKSKHKKGAPKSLEDLFLLLVKDGWPTEQIQRLRTTWFFFAFLAMRATAIAESRTNLRDEVVDIWLRLAEGGKYLYTLVPKNIIWSDSEKLWFTELTKSQREGAQFVVWEMCPAWVQQHSKIGDFAETLGFTASV